MKRDLIQKGIRGDRVTVIHYPVDPADQKRTRLPADVRAEFGVDASTPVIGTFAHLSVKKGYRELVRAAELVLNHIPNAQFWCFGEGPLRGELEQQIQAAGIADRVRLLGFRRDVPDLMRAVDVMCLPSHREPFGLVYVEAALAEKPVIACEAGGAPEIIEHGETGLLVRPQNVPDLAQAILTLLDNRDHAAAMGRRGRDAGPRPLHLVELPGESARCLRPRAGPRTSHSPRRRSQGCIALRVFVGSISTATTAPSTPAAPCPGRRRRPARSR